jgi:hypothetical protein
VCGTNSGGLEKAKAHLAGEIAATELFKNSGDKGFKESLRKEQEKAQAAVDKHDSPSCTQAKTRAVMQDALDAVAPAELQRASKAKSSAEAAAKLYAQSMAALRDHVAGIQDFGRRMEELYEYAKGQWQQLDEMLQTESSQLGAELQDRLGKINADKDAENKAQEAAAKTQSDPADLTIFFAAQAVDAVNVDGQYIVAQVPATEEVRCMLGNAFAFFQAWPTHLPKTPTTFRCIGMRPCDVHTCIGSQIWEAYWGSRHKEITGDQYIPYELLCLLGDLLPHAHPTVKSSEFTVQGAAMYQKVAATAHRKLIA